MPRVRSNLPNATRRAQVDSLPPPLSEITLTAEEEALFDEEFVRDAIVKAMESVRSLRLRREARVNHVLAMRDILFVNWLREHQADLPAGEDDGVIGLPTRAQAYQRVTQFAADHNLGVRDYLRFLEAYESLQHPISESTSDEELSRILQILSTETPSTVVVTPS